MTDDLRDDIFGTSADHLSARDVELLATTLASGVNGYAIARIVRVLETFVGREHRDAIRYGHDEIEELLAAARARAKV